MKTHRIPLSKERLSELGFSEFYYYHESFFWKWFLSVLVIAVFGFFTLKYLLDANFQFLEHLEGFRCNGSGKGKRGCSLVKLIYAAALIFFTLPLWLKLPSAILIAINSLFGFSKKMIHYFDRKPDFAVGDAGIYCPEWFCYQEISWAEIKQVEVRRKRNQHYSLLSEIVKIELVNKNLSDIPLFAKTERKIKVSTTWGYKRADIIHSLKKFGASSKFVEMEEVIHIKEDSDWS